MDIGKLAIGLVVAGTVCIVTADKTSKYIETAREFQLRSFKVPVKDWPVPKKERPTDYATVRRKSPTQELIEQMEVERPKNDDGRILYLRPMLVREN